MLGRRRLDRAVPANIPLAYFLPDLVTALGGLDIDTAYGGHRVARSDGTALHIEGSLADQGVGDGETLTLHALADDPPPKVYDDLVEAVSDAVEARTRPWTAAANRRAALGAAFVAFAGAAAALAAQRQAGLPVAVAAGAIALLLLAGSVTLVRALRETEAGIVVAWSAVPFAVVAGGAATPGAPAGPPAFGAGVAVVLACAVAALGLGPRAAAVIPPATLGLVLAGAGAATTNGTRPALAYTAAMVVTVIAGTALPRLAFMVTRLRAPTAHSDAELLAEPDPIAQEAVEASVRRGRDVLLAVTVGLGAVLVLAAPFAVALNVAGTAALAAAVVAVVLGSRRQRDAATVRAAMVAGTLATAAVAAAVVLYRPQWLPAAAVVLLALGAMLLVAGALPRRVSVRLARAIDVAEVVALIALLPLAVVAVMDP